jgi:hypothetical protein
VIGLDIQSGCFLKTQYYIEQVKIVFVVLDDITVYDIISPNKKPCTFSSPNFKWQSTTPWDQYILHKSCCYVVGVMPSWEIMNTANPSVTAPGPQHSPQALSTCTPKVLNSNSKVTDGLTTIPYRVNVLLISRKQALIMPMFSISLEFSPLIFFAFFNVFYFRFQT